MYQSVLSVYLLAIDGLAHPMKMLIIKCQVTFLSSRRVYCNISFIIINSY